MIRPVMTVVTVLGTMALMGCRGVEEIPTSPVPTITVEATQEPTQPQAMPPLNEEAEWVVVEIPDEGLHFEIPGGWLRPTDAWEWTPDTNGTSVIGVKWADVPAGSEVEAVMLPQGSVVQSREPVDLSWTQANRYMVEVYDQAAGNGTLQAVEAHVIMIVSDESERRAYDVYSRAASVEALAALQPVLDHLIASFSIS